VDKARIPKAITSILKYYNECFVKRGRCMHCGDCIAFALIYSEALQLRLPPRGVPYMLQPGHAWNFVKFLTSSISRPYLRCDRALPANKIKKFALSLLRLPFKTRSQIRGFLFCHAEFEFDEYAPGILVFRMSPRKYELYRSGTLP